MTSAQHPQAPEEHTEILVLLSDEELKAWGDTCLRKNGKLRESHQQDDWSASDVYNEAFDTDHFKGTPNRRRRQNQSISRRQARWPCRQMDFALHVERC